MVHSAAQNLSITMQQGKESIVQEALPRLWNRNYIKVWTANFMLHFSFMMLMPLLPLYLSDTFQSDKHTIGLVLSGYTVAALIIRPFSGYIIDSYPRKIVLLICYSLFAAFFGGYLISGSLMLFAIIRTLHGMPFGATTVSNSTVAIDVLDSKRRAEGIGYFGLSNNLSMALAPTVALYLYHMTGNYQILFIVSLVTAIIGLLINCTLKLENKEIIPNRQAISLDRFFLLKGWSQGISLACFAFSYGILSTYLAIYGKEELGIMEGTGMYFLLLAVGLMSSRLIGGRSLRKGRVTHNATIGMLISLCGYLLFAALHTSVGYYLSALIIGLGNGHMYPAYQTMFINLAPNSQRGTANSTLLTSWDAGVGLGVLLGGVAAEFAGYHAAFYLAWIINLAGVLMYFLKARRHFLRYKLR